MVNLSVISVLKTLCEGSRYNLLHCFNIIQMKRGEGMGRCTKEINKMQEGVRDKDEKEMIPH
jgi:hypothetical protein